jgi:hypothetical protein
MAARASFWLFNNLDSVFGAFCLADSTGNAFVSIYGRGFTVLKLEYSNRAYIDAGSATSAFFKVNFNLNQQLITIMNFKKMKSSE